MHQIIEILAVCVIYKLESEETYMEIEEAKMILERMIPKPSRGDGKSTTHLMITEALNLAIKSLEQIEKITKEDK